MSNDFKAEIDISVKGVDSITSAQKATDELHKSLLKAAESADQLGKGLNSTAAGAKDIAKTASKTTTEISATGDAAKATGDKAKKAGQDMEASWKSQKDSLSNTRYALYDVAAMYGSVGVAATAVAAATTGVAASYEKSFANVARTTKATGEELGKIRNELVALSQVTPVSYADITAVASLGAQLGIANDNLSDFTSTVTMFAASTDVTVERTAMALGRIAQLTQTAGGEIDNLADSIYYTGINAVATEGQILSVAEQIATAGNLSGMANHEIVALASALASLGVAPEAARGSIMRVFANIEKAATQGGESLEKFAQISGTSADHIAQNWGTNTQQVFTEFIEGLGRLSDAGESTNQILADVGIYQVRDVKALQLLLNNMGVYLTAQEDTAKAYKENTALSEGFAIQTDTLVDSLTMLKNNLMAIASAGDGAFGPLKLGIDVLNNLLQVVKDLTDNPIGKVLIGSVGAIAVGVAAWASFHVAINLARGGLAAFITAQIGLQKAQVPLRIGLVQITKEFLALSRGGEAATARLLSTGSAMNVAAGSARNAAVSTSNLGKSLAFLGKSNVIMLGLTAAVTGAMWAWNKYTESQKTAGDKAREVLGDLSGLSQAIAKDTEDSSDSLGQMSVSLFDVGDAADIFASRIVKTADGQYELRYATDDVNSALEKQILLMGDATKAAIITKTGEEIADSWGKVGDVLTDLGFDLEHFYELSTKMDGSAEAYAESFRVPSQEIAMMQVELAEAVISAQEALDIFLSTGDVTSDAFKAAQQELSVAEAKLTSFTQTTIKEHEAANRAVDQFVEVVKSINPALGEAANDVVRLGVETKILNQIVGESEDEFGTATSALDELTKSMREFLAETDAEIGLANSLFSLGEALYKNGNEFDLFSQNGIANMEALRSTVNDLAVASAGDSEAFVSSVFGMLVALEEQGVVVGDELNWVYQMLNQVAGNEYGVDFSTRQAQENIAQFMARLIAMQRAMNATMREQISSGNWDISNEMGLRNLYKQLDAGESKLENLVAAQNTLGKSTDQTAKFANNISSGYNDAAKAANKAGGGAKKTAANTKKAADEAKRLKAEMRTSSDYARDLQGVFSDITDAVFGLGDAQAKVKDNFKTLFEDLTKDSKDVQLDIFAFDRGAARDGIAQMFFDLKQAAADAKKEVRDAVQAVQDGQAKIQGLSAEGNTLEYQLSVAKALGTSERIAEIEAKIAQNQADKVDAANSFADALDRQQKAQDALGRGTTGGSEQDIKNRGDLRDLAKGYMDYADTLRAAGVGEKEIAKYTKQAEKDFIAQGKALGFSDAQLSVYAEGIAAMGKGIADNTTNLQDNQGALNDLYKSHVDAVTAFAATGASQKQVADFAKESEKRFYEQAKQLGFNVKELNQYKLAWDGVLKTIKALPSQVTIRTNVLDPSAAALQKFFTEWNNKQLNLQTNVDAKNANNWKTANTGGRGISAPVSTPVKPSMDSSAVAKVARGYSLIAQLSSRVATITNLMRNPSLANITKIATNVSSAATIVTKLANGSYAQGGFTGRGRKYDEAGVVHKGEYVFPQSDVDQATGQPKPEALMAMLNKTMGISMGNQQPTVPGRYISEQPVMQQESGISLVELLPNQMRQLAQLVGQQMPKQPSIADTTLGVNKINEARTGRGQG